MLMPDMSMESIDMPSIGFSSGGGGEDEGVGDEVDGGDDEGICMLGMFVLSSARAMLVISCANDQTKMTMKRRIRCPMTESLSLARRIHIIPYGGIHHEKTRART